MTFDEFAIELPANLQLALDSVKETESDAKVVCRDGNFVIVWIGEHKLPTEYQQGSADLFVRIPLDFPQAPPYGLLTVPLLRRRDGKPIEAQHANHENLLAFRLQFPSAADSAFWSWKWEGMPCKKSEDLAWVVGWAMRRIREA